MNASSMRKIGIDRIDRFAYAWKVGFEPGSARSRLYPLLALRRRGGDPRVHRAAVDHAQTAARQYPFQLAHVGAQQRPLALNRA